MSRPLRSSALVLLLVAVAAVFSHICVLPGHTHDGDAHHDAGHEHPGDAIHAASCDAVSATAPGIVPPALASRVAVVASVAAGERHERPIATPSVASSPPLFLLHAALLI